MADLKLTIKGPGWQATVKAIPLDKPLPYYAIRTVFSAFTTPSFPENLALLCVPLQIEITLGLKSWKFTPAPFSLPQSLADEETAIRAGKASALVVAGDEDSFKHDGEFTCLAGQLYSQAIPSDSVALKAICKALGLTPPDDRHDHLAGPWVDASGIFLRAKIPLPWQAEPVAALLRLTPDFDNSETSSRRCKLTPA